MGPCNFTRVSDCYSCSQLPTILVPPWCVHQPQTLPAVPQQQRIQLSGPVDAPAPAAAGGLLCCHGEAWRTCPCRPPAGNDSCTPLRLTQLSVEKLARRTAHPSQWRQANKTPKSSCNASHYATDLMELAVPGVNTAARTQTACKAPLHGAGPWLAQATTIQMPTACQVRRQDTPRHACPCTALLGAGGCCQWQQGLNLLLWDDAG
jgi:hypothetical protein